MYLNGYTEGGNVFHCFFYELAHFLLQTMLYFKNKFVMNLENHLGL